ncbi:MAG: SEC-C metal-binding domain-containing protein, partial [Clostridiales bacterium]
HFDMRKNVLQYDDVMNQQREIIYGERRRALYGENLTESIQSMMDSVVERLVGHFSSASDHPEEWDLPVLEEQLNAYLEEDRMVHSEQIKNIAKDEVIPLLKERFLAQYQTREEKMGQETMTLLQRFVILKVVDAKWMDHLDAMDQLRQGIGLRAYGQRDPLIEYKYEAFDMFQEMVDGIQDDVVRYCLRSAMVEAPKERENISANHHEDENPTNKTIRKDPAQQIGRNDPCPCGSGKKYKKCCGKDAQ